MKKVLSAFALSFIACASATAQVNLNAGLLVYYPLDGNFNDYSGNNHTAISHGNMAFTTNQQGQANMAAHFDGIDDWVECPASPQVSPSKTLTVAFRFKTDNIRGQTIVSKADFVPTQNNNVNNIQYALCFNHYQLHNGRMGMFAATEHTNSCTNTSFYANNNSYVDPTDTLFPNTWHCIVFMFDHGKISMFDNGMQVIADTVSAALPNPYSLDSCIIAPLKLGTWWQSDPNFFVGTMDEFRLYNRVLNIDEIAALCSTGDGGGGNDTSTYIPDVNGTNIQVYPNPAGNNLHIDGMRDVPYSISDMTGRILLQGRLTAERNNIDIRSLTPGTYIIQVQGDKAIRSRLVKL